MSRSEIFLFLCLAFIIGVALRSWLEFSFLISYTLFLFSLVIGILGWRSQKIRLFSFMLLFLFLGIWRYELDISKIEKKIQSYNNKRINFIGLVVEEPDIRKDHTKLIIKCKKIFGAGKEKKISGRVLVKTSLYPSYQYGDELEIVCHLKTPEKINDFDWPNYLKSKKIYSVCYYPEIRLVDRGRGNFIYRKIFILKNKLRTIIDSSLPEPVASLFSALLFGVRKGLSPELNETFKKVGLSHILAISGQHITIISSILTVLITSLFLNFLNHKKTFILSFIILFLFIILIGSPVSAVRAGIMGFLGGLAPFINRREVPLNTLVFAGTLMVLINPQILRFDTGFQLSFLAVLGIIYLIPIFLNYFPFFKKISKFLELKTIILMVFSTQIMTLPWVIYKFQIFSLIGILANLLILPVIPFLLFLGLLVSLIGLFWLTLAKILFWIIWLLLTYILKVSEGLARFPWSALETGKPPLIIILVIYLGMWWIIRGLNRREKILTSDSMKL